MSLPTIEHGVPMPPAHPSTGTHNERGQQVRQLVATMQHGDSIVVPSKNAGTYAAAIRERGCRTRSQSLIGTGTVRVWLDVGSTDN